jgi:hypothetical protein
MKLRDHPLMTRKSGMKSWPPLWTAMTRPKSQWPKGEVGTLQQVWMHGTLDNCLFIFIEHQGFFYTGAMYFDDPGFCAQMYSLMKSKLGRSVKEIGDLELSYTL